MSQDELPIELTEPLTYEASVLDDTAVSDCLTYYRNHHQRPPTVQELWDWGRKGAPPMTTIPDVAIDPSDPMPTARVFPTTEVADRLGISLSGATALIKAGTIGHITIGSRKFVPATELVRYIDSRIVAAREAGTYPAA